MTDKLDVETKEEAAFKKALRSVKWPIPFGSVTIQVREDKPKIAKIEWTIKLD